MKLLITGASGKLGKHLAKLFPSALRPTHKELDITDEKHVHAYIYNEQVDTVIHCAALTNIRVCEQSPELAYKVNVQGTVNIIAALADRLLYNRMLNQLEKRTPYLIYISTACVFSGAKGNYVETDLPYPKNYYGLTKLLAEHLVKYSGLKHLIVRTNFVEREKWPYPGAFVDRWGTYLFASDVASAIKSVIHQDLAGVVHICGEEKMSMFELAKITTPDIEPLTMKEYHGPPLTVDMSLSSVRLNPFKISR